MPISSFSLVAGWNNAANLTNVESITPTNSTTRSVMRGAYYFVHFADLDEPRVANLRGVPVGDGYDTVRWQQELMEANAYEYLKSTYEGTVTVRTPTFRTGTFLDYNAIFTLEPVRLDQHRIANRVVYYENVTWVFKLVAQV